MRFPLSHKRLDIETGEIRYDNLSTALIEALMDRAVICPRTGTLSQNYFELPIEEGPLLTLLSQFYELDGEFHVGCSLDRRPPSFSFHHQLMDPEGNGNWYVGYSRELKLDVFQQRDFFHKPAVSLHFKKGQKLRDLDALAEAYNSPSNYRESIMVLWNGRYLDKDRKPQGYINHRVSAEFNEGRMTTLDLHNLIPRAGIIAEQNHPENNPLLSSAKDLPISEIATKYYSKQNGMRQHSVTEVLAAIGYSPAQVLFGMLQLAEKVMPFREGATLSLGLCEKTLNH